MLFLPNKSPEHTWFAASANECIASDSIDADPVQRYAANFMPITVRFLKTISSAVDQNPQH